MKNFILIILMPLLLSRCFANQEISKCPKGEKIKNELHGFVFIEISKIYHHQGKIAIVGENGDSIVYAENKTILINKTVYETIEEEYLYKQYIDIESYNPEYGLFILKCYGISDRFYKVEINGKVGLISIDSPKELIKFKDINQYIMESYPIPTQQNPLRTLPDENSEIINDYDNWTFISVEIKGDWLKIIDNKNCYKGVAPSSIDIVGWVRWKKNGEFILKVAHSC